MPVWVVRGGSHGEHEDFALNENVVAIDFGLRQSVSDFPDRDSLRANLQNAGKSTAAQLWRFANDIAIGDMVALPRKAPKVVAVGRISGEYLYRPDLITAHRQHTRKVEWLATDIPRINFDPDLLHSLGGLMTVYQARADNAESRIEKVVNGHISGIPSGDMELDEDDDTLVSDIDEQIEDRIARRIRERFSGVRLEYLVKNILDAQGYRALQTRSGPDGGIDVVAGKGDMGFGEPRLCVQVKSSGSPVGLPDYDRLQGSVKTFGADHGLLVSLGGFTRDVHKENERSFFQIRLWDSGELVQRVLDAYDVLPLDIRVDIPLQDRKVLIEEV